MKSLIVANENTDLATIPIANFRNKVEYEPIFRTLRQTIVNLLIATFGEKSVPDITIELILAIIEDRYQTFSTNDFKQAFIKCCGVVDTRVYNGQISVSQVTDIFEKYNQDYKVPELENINRKNKDDKAENKLLVPQSEMTKSSLIIDLENIIERIKTTTVMLKMEDDLPILGGIDYNILFCAIRDKYQIELDSNDIEHYREKAKQYLVKDINITLMPDKTKEDRIKLSLAINQRRNATNDTEKVKRVACLLFIRDFIFKKFKPAYMVKIEDRMKDIIIERVGKNLELTELELKNRLSFPEEFRSGSEQLKMEIVWKEICEKYAHKYALMALARKNTSDFLKTFK